MTSLDNTWKLCNIMASFMNEEREGEMLDWNPREARAFLSLLEKLRKRVVLTNNKIRKQ